MTPESFWRLTYFEFRLVVEGHQARRAREAKARRHLAAWLASIVTAPHLKEPISAAALLGEKERKPRKTKEQELDEALDYTFKHYRRD